jgi:hypothetical protein
MARNLKKLALRFQTGSWKVAAGKRRHFIIATNDNDYQYQCEQPAAN